MQINVTNRDGKRLLLSGRIGESLMSVLRGADLVEAICGGQCACATCHVHINPTFIERVGKAEGLEWELLDSGFEANERSRLSCQVLLSEELDGLELDIAQEG